MQVDMYQSLQVAEAAADPPVVLCLEAQSLSCKKQIYSLASCRLEANFQNTEIIYTEILKGKKSISSCVSVELFCESLASRRVSKSILYL